jgi:hypothetical protein
VAKFRRRIFLSDVKVQGALMLRVFAYWLYCLFTISMLLIWWELFTSKSRPFFELLGDVYLRFLPVAAASLLVLPLVMMDILRISNRFAGPARRLKNALRDLGNGKPVANITFRDNDFWKEMAVEFNRVNDRMNEFEARLNPASASRDTEDFESIAREIELAEQSN